MTRPRDIADSINRINSSAADATAVTIDSNEQVGIGTTSPAEMLHVFHASANINAIIESGDANAYLAFKDNSTSGNAHVFLGASGDNMTFFSGGSTERMRLLSGGGLTFNGDTATANALDDYEEGSWTPTLTGTATALANIRNASYIKIGRKVTAQAYLTFATDTDTSPVKITLPFTSHNVSNGYQAGVIGYNTGFTGDHVIIDANTTNMEIRRGSGGNQRLYSEYSTKSIIFGITYITA